MEVRGFILYFLIGISFSHPHILLLFYDFIGGGDFIEAGVRCFFIAAMLPAFVSLIHATSTCNLATLARIYILLRFIAVLCLFFVKVSN